MFDQVVKPDIDILLYNYQTGEHICISVKTSINSENSGDIKYDYDDFKENYDSDFCIVTLASRNAKTKKDERVNFDYNVAFSAKDDGWIDITEFLNMLSINSDSLKFKKLTDDQISVIDAMIEKADNKFSYLQGKCIFKKEVEAAREYVKNEIPWISHPGYELKTAVVKVTRKLAEAMARGMIRLEYGDHFDNRTPLGGNVNKLLDTFTRDRYGINGQGIIFNTEFAMIDGQHRTKAFLFDPLSFTMETLMVAGVDTSSFLTIDDGSVRTDSQVVGKAESTAINGYYDYCVGIGKIDKKVTVRNKQYKMDFLEENDEFKEFVGSYTKTFNTEFPKLKKIRLFGIMFYFYKQKKYKKQAKAFLDALAYGIHSTDPKKIQTDPVYKCRKLLLGPNHEDFLGNGHAPRDRLENMILSAFQCYVKGKPLDKDNFDTTIVKF